MMSFLRLKMKETEIITTMSEEINVPNEAVEERAVVFEEAIEAILFAAGHPISYSTLAKVFEMTPAKIKDKIFEYSIKYNDCQIPRGVILLTFQDSCQLCTKQHYLNEIRDALGIRRSGTLSTSSLEVLAIIAYNQPVTRAFVDTLRRVDSSYAVNNLIDRGLIESKGRLDVPGRPMLYGTTPDFLRSFGLKDLTELPKTSDELIQAFNGVKAEENEKFAEKTEAESGVLADQLSVDIELAMSKTDSGIDNIDTESVEAAPLDENPNGLNRDDYTDEHEPSAEDDIDD